MTARDPLDPRGVIAEAYRIDGIGAAECRAIFLDWSLGAPADPATVAALLARHGPAHPYHPMTAILEAGARPGATPARRGGARGRRAGAED
jgi:hypothetical protein